MNCVKRAFFSSSFKCRGRMCLSSSAAASEPQRPAEIPFQPKVANSLNSSASCSRRFSSWLPSTATTGLLLSSPSIIPPPARLSRFPLYFKVTWPIPPPPISNQMTTYTYLDISLLINCSYLCQVTSTISRSWFRALTLFKVLLMLRAI